MSAQTSWSVLAIPRAQMPKEDHKWFEPEDMIIVKYNLNPFTSSNDQADKKEGYPNCCEYWRTYCSDCRHKYYDRVERDFSPLARVLEAMCDNGKSSARGLGRQHRFMKPVVDGKGPVARREKYLEGGWLVVRLDCTKLKHAQDGRAVSKYCWYGSWLAVKVYKKLISQPKFEPIPQKIAALDSGAEVWGDHEEGGTKRGKLVHPDPSYRLDMGNGWRE
ncbi:hypothetical protein QBC35DRAFT_471170 [Podospora australis]|uniref:Uncharacterized protein n=1 Tax=Podospora australis TaxID=1536484 RepID=A0AAN6WZZ0_9PEZI|nr:hypothetical protein QBC35DRAFT_471170 [Podospora australis]